MSEIVSNNPLAVLQIENHEARIVSIEQQLGSSNARIDELIRDISAVRAEGQQRAIATTHSIDKLSSKLSEMIVQLAAQTGAQTRETELRERQLIQAQTRLANWKRWIAVIGLVLTALGILMSTLLSWQEVASYIWVNILHWREPWSNLQSS